MIQQQLHGSHHFLADSMKQGITDIDTEAQQKLNDFQILILNGNEQSRAAKGINAVDVDLKVDLGLLNGKIWSHEMKSLLVLNGLCSTIWFFFPFLPLKEKDCLELTRNELEIK